jgi:hypothetical protein
MASAIRQTSYWLIIIFRNKKNRGLLGLQGCIGPKGSRALNAPCALWFPQVLESLNSVGPQGFLGPQGFPGPKSFRSLWSLGPQESLSQRGGGPWAFRGGRNTKIRWAPKGQWAPRGSGAPMIFKALKGSRALKSSWAPKGFQGPQGFLVPRAFPGSKCPRAYVSPDP